MNELSRYDVDDYHINQTSSIFVTLEGTTLRLQTPKHGIAKRAIVDETIPQMTFVRQRHFDLYGGRVYLLPSDLVSKRLWSKKYPLCIEPSKPYRNRSLDLGIKDQDYVKLRSADWTSFSEGAVKRNQDGEDSERQRHQPILYLFARTCREKEEWYRRFVAATRGTPWPCHIKDVTTVASPTRSTSPERQSPNSVVKSPKMKHHRTDSTDSTGSSPTVELVSPPGTEIDYGMLSPEQNLAEYMKYMAKIMSSTCCSDASASTSDDIAPSDINEPTLVWLNALIGRCFFDFLREKYWAEKMREKIQKKLCKMHVSILRIKDRHACLWHPAYFPSI
jgi:hypothetical protein